MLAQSFTSPMSVRQKRETSHSLVSCKLATVDGILVVSVLPLESCLFGRNSSMNYGVYQSFYCLEIGLL